jgi:outer membrane protein TolC
VRTAIRRETRLTAPVSGIRRLPVAAAIATALMVGAAGGVASGQIQDARQRTRLIEQARAEEQLMRMRYQLAQQEYEEVKRRVDVGMGDRDSLAAAEQQYRAMENAIRRLKIDMEEIQATSSQPRNDLDAPVVGRRDFVRERMMLELELAQQTLVNAERGLKEAQRRVSVGTAPDTARLHAEVEVVLAMQNMQRLRTNLELRQQLLSGKIQADALAMEVRRTELTLAHDRATREIALARQRLEALRKQASVGVASQLDVKRAEIAILEGELELQRIRTELEALKKGR